MDYKRDKVGSGDYDINLPADYECEGQMDIFDYMSQLNNKEDMCNSYIVKDEESGI